MPLTPAQKYKVAVTDDSDCSIREYKPNVKFQGVPGSIPSIQFQPCSAADRDLTNFTKLNTTVAYMHNGLPYQMDRYQSMPHRIPSVALYPNRSTDAVH